MLLINIFFDLPNLLGILIVILISFRMGLIPFGLSFFLSLFALIPFFLNDFLFPASYMPDQYKYLHIVQSIRSGDMGYEPYGKTVELASWFLALVPLPFVETIYSLGLYNRFISTILTIWLYSSKGLRGFPLLLLLFYPSFLLYSSLALRDTLVLLFMVLSVVFLIENRRLLAVLFSLPLLVIKFQNFFLISILFFIYLSFTKGSMFYKLRFLLLPLVLVGFAPFISSLISSLDFYRRAMFIEDGGEVSAYVGIHTLGDFFLLGVKSAPFFLLKPFPWEVEGLLQLMQSFENIILLIILLVFIYSALKIDKLVTIKWIVSLVTAMTIYGLVVFNYGTAVRYKFPFIIIFIIGISYEIHIKYGFIIKLTKLKIRLNNKINISSK